MDFYSLKFENGKLSILDQTLLPGEERYIELDNIKDVYDAIKTLKLRGAPAIGIGAAYGAVIAAMNAPKESKEAFFQHFNNGCDYIASSRPTAVNLFWAIRRMKQKAESMKDMDIEHIIEGLEAEARLIEKEDEEINYKIGENLLGLLKDGDTVLTHCNAGALATSKYGTALSVFYLAKQRGMNLKVYADETRPLGQGARLTSWELYKSGIDVTLICDNMAAVVMSQGKIDAVIVGCDRIAANGDTANKIGTLGLSVLAKHFGIPMYIAAPTPSIDMDCKSGKDIPIEERDASEVRTIKGIQVAPEHVKVFNPAFDVTPADNITAIVTEKGVVYPPFEINLKKLFKGEPNEIQEGKKADN
ncbi:MAG: S-methyl-5-thioribose-1-phosphate isomerase [Clostridiaceae bacterium]|nr:S-methyl-5-thioribose-1-phosphate isomerase [Clostridiaceae bacterium]